MHHFSSAAILAALIFVSKLCVEDTSRDQQVGILCERLSSFCLRILHILHGGACFVFFMGNLPARISMLKALYSSWNFFCHVYTFFVESLGTLNDSYVFYMESELGIYVIDFLHFSYVFYIFYMVVFTYSTYSIVVAMHCFEARLHRLLALFKSSHLTHQHPKK